MSTRSIIVVSDDRTAFRIYKHYDGYPTGNLPLIASTLEAGADAESVVRAIESRESGARREWSGVTVDEECWGDQGDLEWIYHVDLAARNVAVYGGGYTGDWPGEIVSRGPVDPTSGLDDLTEEWQRTEHDAIEGMVARIRAAVWTVNGS